MDCFESDDDDDLPPQKRDPSCGVCIFHQHTETSLFHHVLNFFAANILSTHELTDGLEVNLKKSREVLRLIDEFCLTRHWMMHIGPNKGKIVQSVLRESMDAKISSHLLNARSMSPASFVVVELGTYCGYASVLMASVFLEIKYSKMKCHLITIEINPDFAKVATEIIKISGLDNMISVYQVCFDGKDTDVINVIQDALKVVHSSNASDNFPEDQKSASIDFVFIDHDKDCYKKDLIKLERSGLIRCGTRVIADNVIFAQIYDYIEYVNRRTTEGVAKTKTIACRVEYSDDQFSGSHSQDRTMADGPSSYADGIEVTDFL